MNHKPNAERRRQPDAVQQAANLFQAVSVTFFCCSVLAATILAAARCLEALVR